MTTARWQTTDGDRTTVDRYVTWCADHEKVDGDYDCPGCLCTRLAEAEGHIRGLVAEMDNYRKLWPERRTLRLAPTNTILEQARAFLEGLQE